MNKKSQAGKFIAVIPTLLALVLLMAVFLVIVVAVSAMSSKSNLENNIFSMDYSFLLNPVSFSYTENLNGKDLVHNEKSLLFDALWRVYYLEKNGKNLVNFASGGVIENSVEKLVNKNMNCYLFDFGSDHSKPLTITSRRSVNIPGKNILLVFGYSSSLSYDNLQLIASLPSDPQARAYSAQAIASKFSAKGLDKNIYKNRGLWNLLLLNSTTTEFPNGEVYVEGYYGGCFYE